MAKSRLPQLSCRTLLANSLATLLIISSWVAYAESPQPAHGIAMHGELKYGPDFQHFDYVNPNAPKGGMLRTAARGTFDSFHGHIPKGNAVSTRSIETLLTTSDDEAFSEYGLIAESLEVPEDRSWVIFNLRQEARWHDGEPITADDVVWSFETLTT
ncbi:MAG: ABC transporter substrate-binding protein, partial [Gammaproteobacteria bacterium]|nr:ABC transporter substrate-binding protein [Gammaproteobacteria bacterium]